MKIAVTYENGQIFQHFGHTEQFKLYEAADGKVTHAEIVDTNGSGHGALAGFLMQHGVDTLICGGIGGGMAYTFVKAQGYEVGKSLCDDSKLDYYGTHSSVSDKWVQFLAFWQEEIHQPGTNPNRA